MPVTEESMRDRVGCTNCGHYQYRHGMYRRGLERVVRDREDPEQGSELALSLGYARADLEVCRDFQRKP